MVAVCFMHYNFVRIHKTLKVTSAIVAGVTLKLWEMADMVKVLEDREAEQTNGYAASGACRRIEEAPMGGSRGHFDNVYVTKAETAVSWFQPHSIRSLELIDAASPDRGASVIDVGGGASTLVDDLLARGFGDVTVLDIAEPALERSKARLGSAGDRVEWIVADVTQWRPARAWDIWHDRAVFHFLTERDQQDAYIAALTAATAPAATVIMATFALDGPERCSGLPVQRYSPATMAARLGSNFHLTTGANETHVTPWGSEQRFSYAVFRWTGSPALYPSIRP